MTSMQKLIKYCAITLAVLLALSIIGGILGVTGLLGDIFFNDAVTEHMTSHPVGSPIHSLQLDISAADLTIRQGESFAVESNLKNLKVTAKNGVLSIKETARLFQNYNGAMLVISIPADTVLESTTLKTGAGRFIADTLRTSALDCDFGAGEIKISSLSALSRADIDGGAGKITISGGAMNNLDLDMGVGQLNFTSALTGSCELDLGVGESNITLLGEKDDYTLDLEKGLGSITVDGKSISNTADIGNGASRVEISGGVGAIHVVFGKLPDNSEN